MARISRAASWSEERLVTGIVWAGMAATARKAQASRLIAVQRCQEVQVVTCPLSRCVGDIHLVARRHYRNARD